MNNLFDRRKTVTQVLESAEHSTLRRHLTATALIALGVGIIVGAGIFVITGQAAAYHAGPAVVISFVLAGGAAALAGLCYSELAALLPVSGSTYSYTYATMGEVIAWIIGWDLMLEYLLGGATIAVGWAGYLNSLLADLGAPLPHALTAGPLEESPGVINLPAAVIVLALTLLLARGVKESARFNEAVVTAKLLVIALFVVFGWSYLDSSNWVPFVPENTGKHGEFGWSGIITGGAVVFFAYIGFDALGASAQEVKNPKRDLPIGILGTLVICTLIYIAVCLVMTGLVSYRELGVAEPMAVALDAAGEELAWLRLPVKLGALFGLTSGILLTIMAQSRILFTISRDGLLPASLSRIHPTFGTPLPATLLVGCGMALMAGLLPIGILAEMVSIGTLMAFTVVCLGVLVLRRTEPDRERAFSTPWVPYVPLAGAGVSIYLMLGLPWETWARLLAWLLIGFAVYFGYGRARSRLAST
ncbi:MAG: amino acid permease [Steroidobacteraceae bacterium]